MNNMTMMEESARRFSDAENMWLWFMQCVRHKTDRGRFMIMGKRIAEPMDIENLITRLYLSGKISRDQIEVLHEFGIRGRAPRQHVYSENKKVPKWQDAIRVITIAASAKGWLEGSAKGYTG